MLLESQKFKFDDFLLDAKEKVLLRGGKPVPITPKAFELLLVLIASHGHLVEKDELIKTVWAESFVEETNLPFTIGLVRKALGDSAQNSRFIETVPKHGYRFIADVGEGNDAGLSPLKTQRGLPSPRPYVLVTMTTILLISVLALAFVWYRGENPASAGRGVNRLTNGGKVTIASISRDGNTLVFAQKEGAGESLWRRDLPSGSQTQILPPAPVEFIGLTVSPANDFAYYSVFAKNAVASNFSRVSLTGGIPEPLSEIASDVSVSFSPDGKQFAYTESHSAVKETRLKIANADGLQSRTLLTAKGEKRVLPVFRASPVAWSSDGKIACAVQETEGSDSFYRILMVNPDDGSERYLSERRWEYVENIVWKDDEHLAIINVEPNLPGRQMWLIARTTGEARIRNPNLKEYEWLSAANGKLSTVEKNTYSSLCIVDFPQGIAKAQTKQIFSEPGRIQNIDWSKDKIFYNSWATGRNEIWQIDPDGTTPTQLTDNSNLTLGFTVSPIDGTLVFSAIHERVHSLFIADADGNNVRQLTFGTFDSLPRFVPDGKSVIFQQGSIVMPTLWRVSTNGDLPPTQLTGYRAQEPGVSPDGKTISYQFMDSVSGNGTWKLGLMDSSNGTLLNKIDFPLLITDRTVVWGPGDDRLTMVFTVGDHSGFLVLSASEGSHQTIENVTNQKISSFAWSPDGKRLAFSANQVISDAVFLDEL